MKELTPSRDINRKVIGLAGAFWALLLLGIAVFLWQSGIAGIGWIVWGVFLLIALGMTGWWVVPSLGQARLGQPEVRLSSDVIRVGERFSFHYQHQFSRPVEIQSIEVSLILREIVIVPSDTSYEMESHDKVIERWAHPGGRYESGQVVSFEQPLGIPADGPPSLHAANNRLQWMIVTRIAAAGGRPVTREYELMVLPEQAPVEE